MKLITAVNDLDTIFEIDTEGQALPDMPVQLMVGNEPVVATEVLGSNGNIVALRVERGANILHPYNEKVV